MIQFDYRNIFQMGWLNHQLEFFGLQNMHEHSMSHCDLVSKKRADVWKISFMVGFFHCHVTFRCVLISDP